MSTMSTKKGPKPPPLGETLEKAAPPFTDVAMRLLYCTTVHAGDHRYRIRELEIYCADDPYTHEGDEQVSTCGGWYFHRTKPGGGWKGGTFMGLDISFAPIGTAGGILIRGLSRCEEGGVDGGQYFDGSCNCTRELLKACGVSKIKDLVDKPEFRLSALTEDGIMRLVEHEPRPLKKNGSMEWKASSRVGLSVPEKKPEQLEGRKKYHLKPYRFLSAPFETKKEKTKIKASTTGGVFTMQDYQALSTTKETEYKEDDGDHLADVSKQESKPKASKKKPPTNDDDMMELEAGSHKSKKPKLKIKLKKLQHQKQTVSQGGGELVDTDDDDDKDGVSDDEIEATDLKPASKTGADLFGDSDDESEASDSKPASKTSALWHYWLDTPMDGKQRGWHLYDKSAAAKLEGFIHNKGQQLSRTTWHLKSGFFSYEVDISKMTQRNMETGTVRPIRRVLPNEVFSMTEPPIYVPPKKSGTPTPNNSKKHAAAWSPSGENIKKKKKKDAMEDEQKGENPEKGLKLEPLFAGQNGYAWEGMLTEFLESLPKAADFIGPNRSKDILPVRELTFRALMSCLPHENMLLVFGEAPYPRVESASGIAMFDSLIQDWDCSQFGKTVSMRCIAKVAAVAKGVVSEDCKIAEMRKAFKQHDIVMPPEWFQAMLSQGVLLLNASLTSGSAFTKAQHTKFWMPVMQKIVGKILQSKRDKFPPGHPKRRIGFLWWGNESLKTKKALASVLEEYKDDVEITHIQHYNPAAQGDKFAQSPNHFLAVNETLKKNNIEPIDWLPDKAWLKEHHCDAHADFITETQELHKLYLERLQAGLDLTELTPIVGIMKCELAPLAEAVAGIGLKSAAESALSAVSHCVSSSGLSLDEKASVYLYTGNSLYRRLNEALRHPNRTKAKVYFEYLRVFLEAYRKMKPKPSLLYRGIYKDLSDQYKPGCMVTWWPVSSCTPNVGVAKNFGGGSVGGTLFHVKTKTAVPIMHLSAYTSEEEYVLAPGTVLKVEKIEKPADGAVQIYLEEVDGKRWVS